MPKEKIITIRADFVNADTPVYISDTSFNKFENNPEFSRNIIDLSGKSEREKLNIIFDLMDNFDKIIIYEKKES
jgi:hypothetical protein